MTFLGSFWKSLTTIFFQDIEDLTTELERKMKEVSDKTLDSVRKLSRPDIEKHNKHKDLIKTLLENLKSKLVSEKRKANSAIEKRALIAESLENAKEFQKRFEENLKFDSLPLEVSSLETILAKFHSLQDELKHHEENQREKFQQAKKFLDQNREPYDDEISLANEVFEDYHSCSQALVNQIKGAELALKQRKELTATLDAIENWLGSTKEFMKGVDLGDACKSEKLVEKLEVTLFFYFNLWTTAVPGSLYVVFYLMKKGNGPYFSVIDIKLYANNWAGHPREPKSGSGLS